MASRKNEWPYYFSATDELCDYLSEISPPGMLFLLLGGGNIDWTNAAGKKG